MSLNDCSENRIEIRAVFTGCTVPLKDVPDPVFASKMVGDGISIDPLSSNLVSPCDGKVIQLHEARHAVTIQTVQGVEILIHIGVDTVKLNGEGFLAHVKEGDTVQTGDLLISFDLDFVALNAKSLLTQVLVTTMDRVSGIECKSGNLHQGAPMFTVFLSSDGDNMHDSMALTEASSGMEQGQRSELLIVPNPLGLHARPSAVIASKARQYSSKVNIIRGGSKVNAKSVTAVMRLDVKMNDEIRVEAIGSDSTVAVDVLSRLITDGAGELHEQGISQDASVPPPDSESHQVDIPAGKKDLFDFSTRLLSPDLKELKGVSVSPGIVFGTTHRFSSELPEFDETAEHPQDEISRLNNAIQEANVQLENLFTSVSEAVDSQEAEIFKAHSELLSDPMLMDDAVSEIENGASAEAGWYRSFVKHAKQLEKLSNELLSARAADLRDVGLRVLRVLTGALEGSLSLPENTIIIATELTPSDTATLDRTKVAGFCTVVGGATSHSAILARSLSLPAVSGLTHGVLTIPDGTKVILDGTEGILYLNTSKEKEEAMRATLAKNELRKAREQKTAFKPARTKNKSFVQVVSNIGSIDDAREAFSLGSEGVGLLRSEFLFMERKSAPTEERQFRIYEQIARCVGKNRTLTIRTLDIGGDKPLPYIAIAREDNPFLGERGIRLCLNREEILRPHLRAILRVSHLCNLQIMFPMISTIEEFHKVKKIVADEVVNLAESGYTVSSFKLGIMVEVPSVAIRAREFAREVDFLSIGTNDLSQYTLAMDRGHPLLSAKLSALDPSVLTLIKMTAAAGKEFERTVSVCGGIASDYLAGPLLVGLGIRKLSASGPSIPSVKASIRRFSIKECRKMAEDALNMNSSEDVRKMLLEKAGEDR